MNKQNTNLFYTIYIIQKDKIKHLRNVLKQQLLNKLNYILTF